MWTTQARQRYAWTRRKEGLRITNAEWALIEPLLPQHSKLGRPWTHERRTVLDAIFHLLSFVLSNTPFYFAPQRRTAFGNNPSRDAR